MHVRVRERWREREREVTVLTISPELEGGHEQVSGRHFVHLRCHIPTQPPRNLNHQDEKDGDEEGKKKGFGGWMGAAEQHKCGRDRVHRIVPSISDRFILSFLTPCSKAIPLSFVSSLLCHNDSVDSVLTLLMKASVVRPEGPAISLVPWPYLR